MGPFLIQQERHQDTLIMPPYAWYLKRAKSIKSSLKDRLLERDFSVDLFDSLKLLFIGTEDPISGPKKHYLLYSPDDVELTDLFFTKNFYFERYLVTRSNGIDRNSYKHKPKVFLDKDSKFKQEIPILQKGFYLTLSNSGSIVDLINYSPKVQSKLSHSEKEIDYYTCYAGKQNNLKFLYFPVSKDD